MGGLDCGFIAVGFDGTPESAAAARWALSRAAGMQAAVKIVHCWPGSMPSPHGAGRTERGAGRTEHDGTLRTARDGARGTRHQRAAAIRAVEDAVAAARVLVPQPPEIGMVFASGSVESVLASHAQGAALLVLGASAPGVLSDPAIGPVAGPCLQRVGCPIVVVDRHGRVATARPRYPVLGLAG